MSADEFNVDRVRQRAGMYVGDTSTYGLYHLGYFVLDLLVAAVERPPSWIEVRLETDGSMVASADCEAPDPAPTIAILEAGAFGGPVNATQALPWFEVLTVSALAEFLRLEWRSPRWGTAWTGSRGRAAGGSPAPAPGPAEVRIQFRVDPTIFKVTRFDFDHVVARLCELAAFHPGIGVRASEATSGREFTTSYPRGLASVVSQLAGIRTEFPEPLVVDAPWGNIRIRAAVQWAYANQAGSQILSYANSVRTRGGGAHEAGLLQAVEKGARSGWAPLEGLVAAIAVDGPRNEIEFQGPTKDVLRVTGLEQAVLDLLLPVIKAARGQKA